MGQRASLPKVINLKTRNAEAADVIQNCEIAPRLQHFRSKVDALVATERISILFLTQSPKGGSYVSILRFLPLDTSLLASLKPYFLCFVLAAHS